MKKIVVLLLALFAGSGLQAQSLTPYTEYKIKEGVTVQINEIKRVEKYGWDNLEVVYVLKNETSFDIQKLDFMIHLLDKNQKEIGTIKAHACEIPKLSENTLTFVEVGSEYINEKIVSYIPETINMDVVIDSPDSQIVSVKGAQNISIK